MILRILFICANGFLPWPLREFLTYRVTPAPRARFCLRRVFPLSLYLYFAFTEVQDQTYLGNGGW